VRELRAVVRSAARCASGASIDEGAVDEALRQLGVLAEPGAAPAAVPFAEAGRALRSHMLRAALAGAGGNQTLAGIRLGFHARRSAPGATLDLRARKLAHRRFRYWWERLVEAEPG